LPIKTIDEAEQAITGARSPLTSQGASDDRASGRESQTDGQTDSLTGGQTDSQTDDQRVTANVGQGQAALDALEALTKGATATLPKAVPLPKHLTEEMRRMLDWHWAQLEYGCSAPLNKVPSDTAATATDTHYLTRWG
jgi:hypothetical protein